MALVALAAHLPREIIVALIRGYQLAALPFPSPCRYEPSCSSYAIQAVRKYGAVKGSWLGLRRILRCHPLHAGGFDPVR